ncbi:MAG: NAD(P)-binding domain-containing protein [Gaiellaceae bacterium]
MPEALDVAIIGAGPYGLSVAAHLRGLRTRIFGAHMETWRSRMPDGMLLRSAWKDTSLSAPAGKGTIDAWAAATDEPREEPIRLERFLGYADWFTSKFVDEHDPAAVARVEAANGRYSLVTTAGDELLARRIVLAVGVTPFANAPPPFDGTMEDGVSFSTDRQDFKAMSGKRLAIVGGGQSALDAAVLALEAGVQTELIVRSRINWFEDREPHYTRSPLRQKLYDLAYPVVGYGPPPLNRLATHPDLFAKLPPPWRRAATRRMLRPGASPAFHSAIVGQVRMTEEQTVTRLRRTSSGIELELSGGGRRDVDRVVIAAGYRFRLDVLTMLSPELRERIAVADGWPDLDRYFRSTSEPDLLFVGYPAEGRFGPAARYVLGVDFAASRAAAFLRS